VDTRPSVPHQGLATRLLHACVGAIVLGLPLAWVSYPLWGPLSSWIGLAIIALCAFATGRHGDAIYERVAASRWWAVVRGYFQLRGR
jgi:hypothetical protein